MGAWPGNRLIRSAWLRLAKYLKLACPPLVLFIYLIEALSRLRPYDAKYVMKLRLRNPLGFALTLRGVVAVAGCTVN